MEKKVNDTQVVGAQVESPEDFVEEYDDVQYPAEPAPQEVETVQQPVPFFNREPVAIMAVIRAGLAMAVGFGFSLDPEQMALIILFVEAVLALITRQQVTPYVAAGTTPNVNNSNKTPLVG